MRSRGSTPPSPSDRPPAGPGVNGKPVAFDEEAQPVPPVEPELPILDAESAAAIAHHVKNPLAGIRGAVEFLGARLPQGDDGRDVARKIVSRVDELDVSLDALLLFLRPPSPKFARVDLNALLEPFASGTGPGKPVPSATVVLSGDRVFVSGDERQLQRLVLAVLTNAVEATPDGSALIEIRVTKGSRFVTASFMDYGAGIPAELASRVFEPFFTTKPRALGLGLTNAARTARTHGGWLKVVPQGSGTEVQLSLPLR